MPRCIRFPTPGARLARASRPAPCGQGLPLNSPREQTECWLRWSDACWFATDDAGVNGQVPTLQNPPSELFPRCRQRQLDVESRGDIYCRCCTARSGQKTTGVASATRPWSSRPVIGRPLSTA